MILFAKSMLTLSQYITKLTKNATKNLILNIQFNKREKGQICCANGNLALPMIKFSNYALPVYLEYLTRDPSLLRAIFTADKLVRLFEARRCVGTR